jgi:hypothetical protein
LRNIQQIVSIANQKFVSLAFFIDECDLALLARFRRRQVTVERCRGGVELPRALEN